MRVCGNDEVSGAGNWLVGLDLAMRPRDSWAEHVASVTAISAVMWLLDGSSHVSEVTRWF